MAWAVDKQLADCFAVVVAYLDVVVQALASVESLVLTFKQNTGYYTHGEKS